MTHPNPSTAMAVTILDEFSRHGVRHVVVAPGSRSAALAMAAAASDSLELHVEIDERSAGFLAVGIGRATGTPALVVTTSGTAVANLVPAVIEADLSCVPMVVLSADRPPELRDRGANQTIDQHGIFGGAVRWEFDPGPAEDRPESNAVWRSMASRAVAAATGLLAAPGPVHLDLPFREPLVPASDDGRVSVAPFHSSTEGRPDGSPWTTVEPSQPGRLKLSDASRRTLVLAGDIGIPAALELEALAVVAEPHSGSRRPGTLVGTHHVASHPVAERLRPDTVVRLGRTGLSRPIESWLGPVPTSVFDPRARWSDPQSDAVSIVTGSMELPRAEPGWLSELRRVDEAVSTAVSAALDESSEPTEPRIARDVARAVPPGGALVLASSMPIRDAAAYMEPRDDIAVHANRGASGIDGFVSTALGVALAGGRPTLALAGDLSMLHDANGLLLDERPDCVFVVVDNDGGGIFSFLPQASHPEPFERVFGTPHGRSFERLAALHDVPYASITRADELDDAIEAALGAGGVHIVSVRTDRSENVEVHRRLTAAAHRAIDALD